MTIYAKIYLIFIIIMSIITFFAYAIDKKKAIKRKSRISEVVLLSLSIFGGAIGGYIGMVVMHHKTRHWYFMLTNIFGVAIQVVIFYFLVR